MTKRYFLVTSRGQCGTRWLAKALSEIGGVHCSHGPGNATVSLSFDEKIASVERRKQIEEVVPHRMATMGTDAVFDELKEQAEATAYGNIHMFTLPALDNALRQFPNTYPYQVANLIRHPIPWIESATYNKLAALTASSNLRKSFVAFYLNNREVCENLTRPFGVDPLEPSALCFLNTALGSWSNFAEELSWIGVQHIRMEDITSRPSSFQEVATHLLGESVPVTSDDLERVFALGKVNRHSKRKSVTPEQQFEMWPAWKQKTIRVVWEQVPQVQLFKSVGYDFSFLEQRAIHLAKAQLSMADYQI